MTARRELWIGLIQRGHRFMEFLLDGVDADAIAQVPATFLHESPRHDGAAPLGPPGGGCGPSPCAACVTGCVAIPVFLP